MSEMDDLIAEQQRQSGMLAEALRLGDVLSGQVADHSLRARRLERAMRFAMALMAQGKIAQARAVLDDALKRNRA